ncbi:leucine-rich repeat-containing protein 46 isoform X2 [Corapipo altera]|uniref:leucine-rich repeat-containing protein 46 isoform X2 n=1 Tax=Corapipo altera TaxID=415028 RepID=UPI000FD69831|nr:leucine-rich repeat-containing protein 46 isoform X2 [Corapipo altera]
MSEQEEKTLCGDHEGTSPGVTLSDNLILTRSRSTELLPPSTIRLDRENISSIGKLKDQGGIHSLYLQQNKIERIENLGCFPNLRFLCLAGNRIQRVENLQPLPHLCALDLSHNLIQVLDTEELPQSLQILDLTGNECTRQQGYRELVLGALPHLLQLDAQPLRGKEEEGGGSSRGEDEDDELLPEPGGPFTVDRGFFADLRRELVGRSQRRRRETLEEHRARLEELQERRDLLLSRDRDGAPDSAAPQPRQGHSRPRAQPGTPLRGSHGSQRAPGGVQSRRKTLEKETGAKGTGNRQLSQISRSSVAQRGQE